MCQFFSFCSNGRGKYLYTDWKTRQALMAENPHDYEPDYEPDSHASILSMNGIEMAQQDKWNKYEYNPLTKRFTVDQINNRDDSKQSEKWVNGVDFSEIVKPLLIKPIRYPFDKKQKRVTKKDIALLKQWDSVWDSVWNSVWDSVWGYTSSFFDIEEWKYIDHEPGENPFQCCIDLWERGLVPSFDGEIWRLHGDGGFVIYKINKENLIINLL